MGGRKRPRTQRRLHVAIFSVGMAQLFLVVLLAIASWSVVLQMPCLRRELYGFSVTRTPDGDSAGSDCVGAIAFRAGTFRRICAIKTKRFR